MPKVLTTDWVGMLLIETSVTDKVFYRNTMTPIIIIIHCLLYLLLCRKSKFLIPYLATKWAYGSG